MIPTTVFREFNSFYNRIIPDYRSKYFVQVRDDKRSIQVFLRNFGWIEITPISFSEIYIDIIKDINNKQTYLFVLRSTKELIDLFQTLSADPTASLPKAIVYKEAPPSAPIRPRKPDKKAERKATQKEIQKDSPKEEKKLKEKEKKFKKELLEIEQQMKEEKEKKQEESIVFYQPEVEPIVEEPKVENANQDDDLF